MECHVMRGVLRLQRVHASARLVGLSGLGCSNAVSGGQQSSGRRLYHPAVPVPVPDPAPSPDNSTYTTSRLRWRAGNLKLLGSPVVSRTRQPGVLLSCPCPLQQQQTRTIIISKVIDVLRESKLTSYEDLQQSAPVNAVKHLYEWVEASTGLPWTADILICSFALQLVFSVPSYIYMARWMAAKEKQDADMVAIRAPVMRKPTRAGIKMITEANKELATQYGCERYKLFAIIFYQIVHFFITTLGVRALIVDPSLGIATATLPWGTLLGVPGLILPFVNASLNLLLVEVDASKKFRSHEGLAMTFKRAGLPMKPEPLYLLNLKRCLSASFILIYAIVPSAMTLHWFVIAATSLNVQLLLTHKKTRQALGIPSAHYETDAPYKDFLYYLRKEMKIRGKKV